MVAFGAFWIFPFKTLERREKRSKIDKVRRLSRALNPKHWRHSRPEPGPLPHPSAMGLMALAARPPSGTQNDYHHEQQTVDRTSSLHSGSTNTETSTDDEEENFYEDVEIGPIKSATMESKSSELEKARSGFAGFLYKSLPSPRRHRRQRNISKTPPWDNKEELSDSNTVETNRATNVSGATSMTNERGYLPSSDEPKSSSMDKALRWASKLGDKIQNDLPGIGKIKEGSRERNMRKAPDIPPPNNFCANSNTGASSPPSDRAPSPPVGPPPPRSASLGIVKDNPTQTPGRASEEAATTGHDKGPVAPARKKRATAKTLSNTEKSTSSIGKNVHVPSSKDNDSNSNKSESPSLLIKDSDTKNPKVQPLPRKSLLQTEKITEASHKNYKPEAPKPKPRGIKSQTSLQPMPSVNNVIQSMNSLAIEKPRNEKLKEEDNSSSLDRPKRVPPPIKPRTF
ncbi:hypothetical protein ElyMa_004146800 [Elysia marginata]|uniref:Uncharacterized protein n=1 Tax=Elysia marginata TaxID=1093978 RepID=A0AAV4GIN2_9GAST|nr:hypothetical protein ElyMa_004146800 [Elysia marginata]